MVLFGIPWYYKYMISKRIKIKGSMINNHNCTTHDDHGVDSDDDGNASITLCDDTLLETKISCPKAHFER